MGVVWTNGSYNERTFSHSSINLGGTSIMFGNNEAGTEPMKLLSRVDIYSQRYSKATSPKVYNIYKSKRIWDRYQMCRCLDALLLPWYFCGFPSHSFLHFWTVACELGSILSYLREIGGGFVFWLRSESVRLLFILELWMVYALMEAVSWL